jgi:hypothetical protein
MATSDTYRWHDGILSCVFHVAERHLRALVFVELELGEIDIRDLIQRSCFSSASIPLRPRSMSACLTLALDDQSCHANSGVCGHLLGPQSPPLKTLLSQLRCPVLVVLVKMMMGMPERRAAACVPRGGSSPTSLSV